jgi:hypothetical protein
LDRIDEALVGIVPVILLRLQRIEEKEMRVIPNQRVQPVKNGRRYPRLQVEYRIEGILGTGRPA